MRKQTELPLLRWGDELRRAKIARQRLRRRAAIGVAGIAALGLTIAFPPLPRFVWNASASAPIGLYRVSPGALIDAGDMVIARVPEAARDIAARRHYIPANVPLVKRVAGVPGDTVCAIGETISVNGQRVAIRLAQDGQGRPMPWWHGCATLRRGALFLLMADSPASFDGRYFGPTMPRLIVGKATLLWAR